jgi:hypothetical protein
MMKTKHLLGLLLLFCSTVSFAQIGSVGIGTTIPDKSAILDLSSSNKGFLVPRMTAEQRVSILNPAEGLLIYQTTGETGLFLFNGIKWVNSVAAVNDPWVLGGNAGSADDFIGTSLDFPLKFKVFGQKAGTISSSGFTNIGYLAGENMDVSATRNMALGAYALRLNTTGNYNAAIGFQALNSNVTGNKNTAIGDLSLYSNNTGDWNMSIGSTSLYTNTSGSWNTAIGANVLVVGNGNSNIGIGYEALRYATGNNNVGIGTGAGLGASTSPYSTGSDNTFVGHQAGNTMSSGSRNVLIGFQAGVQEDATSNDKLIITNSNTLTPLLYGDFAAKFISVGNIELAKRDQIANSGSYGLLVEKGILTEKVKVALKSSGDWADYVFEPTYELMSLEGVEQFTKDNKHLPGVPSADDMASTGLDVAETSKMFMEKIEELTLYLIDLNKEVKAVREENKELRRLLD